MAVADPPERGAIRHCPRCGAPLDAKRDEQWSQRCPLCAFAVDESTIVLDGRSGADLNPAAWAVVLGVAGLLLFGGTMMTDPWFMIAGIAAGCIGAAGVVWNVYVRRTGRARLVLSRRGVTLLRGGRQRLFVRWHLLEEARIAMVDPRDAFAEGGRRVPCDMLLVNAYKPSISTFLHSRGTDEAIFAWSIDFVFDAPRREVERLRETIGEHIAVAQQRYRVLNLRQMEKEEADPDRLLKRQWCLVCEYPLRGLAEAGSCPECGERYHRDDFVLDGAVVGGMERWRSIGILTMALAVLFMACAGFGAAIAVVVGAIAVAALTLLRGLGPRRLRRSIVIARRSVEEWQGSQRLDVHPWATLGTFAYGRTDLGRWRLAFWRERKSRVRFNSAFWWWSCSPPGGPLIDVVVDADEEDGRLIVEEIERRRAAAGVVEEVAPPTEPAERSPVGRG